MDEDNLELADFLYQSDEIDRMIEERAGAFNLNGTNIRNILYHVVQLGVRPLTSGMDMYGDDDDDGGDFTLQLPEPKTRAAKLKLQQATESLYGGTSSSHNPRLTLPEVRSPEHDEEDDEDIDYLPQNDPDYNKEDSDEEGEEEGLSRGTPRGTPGLPGTHPATPSTPTTPTTPVTSKRPNNDKQGKRQCNLSESYSKIPTSPAVGLAKRTRSYYSLKDKELFDLELDLQPETDDEDRLDKTPKSSSLSAPQNLFCQTAGDSGGEKGPGLLEQLELTQDGELSQTEDEAEDAPNDEVFGLFLAGIKNPKKEFPEDGSEQPYRYNDQRGEPDEEFRTDKEVTVSKKEVTQLLKELDKLDPEVKNMVAPKNSVPIEEEQPVLVLEDGPLFTQDTLDILKEQLQMHLQLLVQHCVLAAGTESLKHNYNISLLRIEELEEYNGQESTDKLIEAMKESNNQQNSSESVLKCLDIYTALEIAKGENQKGNRTNPSQHLPLKVPNEVSHIKNLEPLSGERYAILNYTSFFHRYLHLRPTVNFLCKTKVKPQNLRKFSQLEDNLLVHGLDAFKHISDTKIVHSLIHQYYLPVKTVKQIAIRVKNRLSSSAGDNVIRRYRRTGIISYDTSYQNEKLLKMLSSSKHAIPEYPQVPPPVVNPSNLEWLKALRDHRRKLQREYGVKKKQKLVCTKENVITTARLMTTDDVHNFEITFFLKAKDVLKNDPETYFNLILTLTEYNSQERFDCGDAILRIIQILQNYPDLSFEFLSMFSPLPDMSVSHILETLSHVKTRILLRNIEQHFKSNPNQYKKILKLLLASNSASNPTLIRDLLFNMLRGKPDLIKQISEYFDRCSIKPEANDFEVIDLTEKNMEATTTLKPPDDVEEIVFLDRTSKSTKRHNELVQSIHDYHDRIREEEQERKLEEKQRRQMEKIKSNEEKRKQKLEKRKLDALNVVECGDKVLTWTREEDRQILKTCQMIYPRSKAIRSLAKTMPSRTEQLIKDRYYTLLQLMKKARKAAERKQKLLERSKKLQKPPSTSEAKENLDEACSSNL